VLVDGEERRIHISGMLHRFVPEVCPVKGTFLLVSLVSALSLMPARAVTDPNLVGWWKLDNEGTGTALDSSGYERHGSFGGNPQFVAGVLGDALELDGDDYVTIGGYRGVLGTHAFSIAAWIRTTNTADEQIAYWGTHSAGRRVEHRIVSNRLRFGPGNGNVQGDTNVTDGEWHHVVVTLKENAEISYPDAILYVDGEDDTRPSVDPEGDKFDIKAGWNVTIGWRPSKADRPFIGSIDDVRIYDKVLTQAEIRELTEPPVAHNPIPADRANGIESAPTLSWSPGKYAAWHNVYFGTDSNDLTLVSENQPLDSNSYGPVAVELGTTYFWRIDEANSAHPDSPWKGQVWSFRVQEYQLVDDFDSYADTNDLLLTWIDGNGNGTSSSISLETEFAGNSMNYVYDNSLYPWFSEAERTYSTSQDWTVGGAKALEMRFRGDANNSPEQMYVALEDVSGNSSVVTHGEPNALIQEEWEGWQIWNIALQEFVDTNNVDLANIKKLAIGIGDGVDPLPLTSTGKVYFDDIRLYPARCFPEYVTTSFNDDCTTELADLDVIVQHWLASDYDVVAVEPNNNRLQVYYRFDETSGTDAQDSSGKGYHAVVDIYGADAWDPCGYDGGCLDFDGTFAVSVPSDVFRDIHAKVTISVWLHTDTNVNPNTLGRAELGAGPTDPNQPWDRLAWVQQEPERHVGRWNHYAFVKDANRGAMRIYHNGLLVAQNIEALQPMDGADAGQSVIGSEVGGGSGYYKGKLDDLRIYDYALSHAEILYLAAGSGSELHQPLQPVLSPVDPDDDGKITLRDFAALAELWLKESLWP